MYEFTQRVREAEARKDKGDGYKSVQILPSYSKSSVPMGRIESVSLSLLSEDEMRKLSVCEITSPSLFIKHKPVIGSVFDPRMGPIDQNQICSSCRSYIDTCTGHFGHITLPMPVYHVCYLSTILKVLRCVCHYCSRLLLDSSNPKFLKLKKIKNPLVRLSLLAKLSETIEYCGGPGPTGSLKDRSLEDFQSSGCHNLQPLYEQNKKNKVKFTVWFRESLKEPGEDKNTGIKKGNESLSSDSGDCIPDGDDDDTEELVRVVEEQEREEPVHSRAHLRKTSKKFNLREGPFSPEDARDIFCRIPKSAQELLGFQGGSHPKDMIMKIFPVSPPCVRINSIGLDGKKHVSHTDATKLLQRIFSYSNQIFKKQEMLKNASLPDEKRRETDKEIEELFEKLQQHTAAYINNDVKGVPSVTSHSNIPLKSVTKNWVTKGGLIRGNLNAKRTDYTARSVITPGYFLDLDELGVPIYVCMKVTFPERVTPFNRTKLLRLVQRGPNLYPGAMNIIKSSGVVLSLRYIEPSKTNLAIGDIVERHLMKGDVVLFNRQPSLHRMSIMAHRVVPIEQNCFKLNLSCTSPYNADFDGDEMNLHVPQDLEAKAEAKELMMVHKHINSNSCMGAVQDTLLGAYLMTRKDTFLTKAEMFQCLCQTRYFDDWMANGFPHPAIRGRRKGKAVYLWTGRQLISMLFPSTVYISKKASKLMEGGAIIIQHGQVLAGQLTKKVLGPRRSAVAQQIIRDHGPEEARRFLSDIQRLTNYFISEYGYGISITDCTTRQRKQVEQVQRNAIEFLSKWDHPDPNKKELFTQRLVRATREEASRLVQQEFDFRRPNQMEQMTNCGAKGSGVNVCQTKGMVGQVFVEGQRIKLNYGRGRAIPIFKPNDPNPVARGFVKNSFVSGLTPQETFFHAQGGREGLVDTSSKTAKIGYLNRKFMRGMEDVIVQEDYSVRELGRVISFLFGDDNFDPDWLETEFHNALPLPKKEILALYDARGFFPKLGTPHQRKKRQTLLKNEVAKIIEDVVKLRKTKLYFSNSLDARIQSPVNFGRYIQIAKNQGSESDEELTPEMVLHGQENLICWLFKLVKYPSPMFHLCSLIRIYLSTKNIIIQQHLNPSQFNYLIERIKSKIQRSMIQSGAPVGCLSGHHLGEPCTQMTLNTFHLAGVGLKNACLGIPRLDEMVRVSEKIANPSMEIYLKPDEDVSTFKRHVVWRDLDFFVVSYQHLFDPIIGKTQYEPDVVLVSSYFDMFGISQKYTNFSPIVLRIELDKELLISHQRSIIDVVSSMKKKLKCSHLWVFSPVSHAKWVIRLRLNLGSSEYKKFRGKAEGYLGELVVMEMVEADLRAEISVAGIKDILEVEHEEITVLDINPNSLRIQPKKRFLIRTSGSNLREMLVRPEVDAAEIMTNNIYEVQQVLGIEAASMVLLQELQTLLFRHGAHVDYHYLHTIVSTMSRSGQLVSMTRHGFNQDRHIGFLRRCSFEEMIKIIMESAYLGDKDKLKGNTNNLIMGQPVPIGTHFTEAYPTDTLPTQPQTSAQERLMDPLDSEELLRLIPPLESKRPNFHRAMNRSALHKNEYLSRLRVDSHREIPDYSDWLPPAPQVLDTLEDFIFLYRKPWNVFFNYVPSPLETKIRKRKTHRKFKPTQPELLFNFTGHFTTTLNYTLMGSNNQTNPN